MNVIILSIIVLGIIGIVGAAVLFVVARRFHVQEDPRIDEVEALLPGANCGGCGRSGCRDFAAACVCADTLDGLNCPSSSTETMKKIGEIVGLAAVAAKPKIAVIKCNGTCDLRPLWLASRRATCSVLASLGTGESACPSGCLGCGDCVTACPWGAMRMNPETGLPEVIEDKCVGCGACVKACPRAIIELRNKGPRGMRVYVACSNREKGAVAMKECKAACIGCAKCAKSCTHEAITVASNLAYIDFEKCKLCKKCVDQCPTHAIHAVNFPVKKAEPAQPQADKQPQAATV